MLLINKSILACAFIALFASVSLLSAMKRRFDAIGDTTRECELMQAISSQEYERARDIINEAPIDLNKYMHNPGGMTTQPLMCTLRKSISPYSYDVEHDDSLLEKKRDFIAFLLEQGANPNIPILDNVTYELRKDVTLLDRILSAHKPGYRDIAKLLLLYGAYTKQGRLGTHFSLEELTELEKEKEALRRTRAMDREHLQELYSEHADQAVSFKEKYDRALLSYLESGLPPRVLRNVVAGYHHYHDPGLEVLVGEADGEEKEEDDGAPACLKKCKCVVQ